VDISRIIDFLENWFKDGKIVSLKGSPCFTPEKDCWYSFMLEAVPTQGHVVAGRIRKGEKKINDHIRNWNCTVP
jgi:hypothetical protein